jgi:hypothetical protein
VFCGIPPTNYEVISTPLSKANVNCGSVGEIVII